MAETLWNILQWCEEKNRHEFTKQEVKHLITNDVVSANFAYWRWFGGLVYNPDDVAGHYGLNMQRCRDFFAGKIKIPIRISKHPLKQGEEAIHVEEYSYIHKIPKLWSFLDKNKNYIARYRDPQVTLF